MGLQDDISTLGTPFLGGRYKSFSELARSGGASLSSKELTLLDRNVFDHLEQQIQRLSFGFVDAYFQV